MYEAEFYKREADSYAQKLKEMEIKFEELKKKTEQEINIKTENLKADDLFETNKKSPDSLILKQNNRILMLEDNSNKH
ncbi:hypothetical protein [Neobacillus bataviensis]|uniref:hypothetical protein n=1 Tax=Neobacillus bataviensis TaxID=220685 RepID=UPI001CC17F95|nr:hypothetical protein [Neobacillus bataviensis]